MLHIWDLVATDTFRGLTGWGIRETIKESKESKPTMNIQKDTINDLLVAHCGRVIESMDHDDLYSYAMRMMMMSFDIDPGQGNTDLPMLIQDIITAEGGDEDSASEFISGAVNLEDDEIDELIAGDYTVD